MVEQMIVYCLLLAGPVISARLHKLTPPAAVAAGLTGLCVYQGSGIPGLVLLVAFFVLGTLATRHKWALKQQAALAEQRAGARNVWQVLANGGVAAAAGIMVILFPDYKIQGVLMVAASLAAATSDTLSSELGNVYGRRYVNALTLQPDTRGRDGVISLEGTVAGVAGSAVISILFGAMTDTGLTAACIVFTSGVGGNLFDSVLGATVQRNGRMGNDLVNLLNTLFAALCAIVLSLL